MEVGGLTGGVVIGSGGRAWRGRGVAFGVVVVVMKSVVSIVE